ncbi:hypothetical protein L328_0121715 [Yersinia pestis 24H]|nr:hypothetical protein L328_0121715 [Yersinia pestis 24H]
MKGINGQNILNFTWEEALLEAMEKTQSVFIRFIVNGSLVKQILIGLVAGIVLALVSTPAAIAVGLLGSLFVGALKAVAPVLVLMLVIASIANHKKGQKTSIRPILFLYVLGTFSAALVAVVVSFIYPSTLFWWLRLPISPHRVGLLKCYTVC